MVDGGGTAELSSMASSRCAGKTGTVRKIAGGGGYAKARHQAVFIGMIPAEHPRLVGLVMIDEPAAGACYGGLVAGPVFASVMQGAARLLQIAPDQQMPAPMMGALQVLAQPATRVPHV